MATEIGTQTSGARSGLLVCGILFVLAGLAWLWSLRATPSPGLPERLVSPGLFWNDLVAWIAAGVLVASALAGLGFALAGWAADRRLGTALDDHVREQDGRVEDLTAQTHVWERQVGQLESERRDLVQTLEKRDARLRELESKIQALEFGAKEQDLRVRELELELRSRELDRERHEGLQKT